MIRKYIIVADDSIKGFDEEIAKLEREWGAEEIEPSEDCISREAVRKLICQNNDYYGYSERFHEFTEKCLQLPPVTPQRPKGSG